MVRWSVDVQKSSGDDVKFQHNWFLAELFRSQGRWRLTAGFSFGGSQLRFALSIKKSLLEVVAWLAVTWDAIWRAQNWSLAVFCCYASSASCSSKFFWGLWASPVVVLRWGSILKCEEDPVKVVAWLAAAWVSRMVASSLPTCFWF